MSYFDQVWSDRGWVQGQGDFSSFQLFFSFLSQMYKKLYMVMKTFSNFWLS